MPTTYPSLANQVDHALGAIFRPGAKRGEAKRRRDPRNGGTEADKLIFSYGTRDRYRAACLALLRALDPADRPRYLKDVTPETIVRGLDALRARGNDGRTIKTQLAAWRKLAHGLNRLGWSTIPPETLVPPSLGAGLEPSRPQGPVSPAQVEAWRAELVARAAQSRQYGDDLIRMFDLIAATGIRIDEAARLTESMIDRDAGVLRLRQITKGGRPRDVPLDSPEARAALEAIPPGRHWLWPDGPALARRLQDVMRAAADAIGIDGRRGPHRLRAAWAEAFLRRRLAAGDDEQTARLALTERLGHGRVGITYRYVPRLSPRGKTRA